jgi:hypothetical protein
MPEKVEITASSVFRLLHPMHMVLARAIRENTAFDGKK